MHNWYKQIKIANALAKSLGILGGPLFSDIQRFEKELKKDGSWNKIKDKKKKSGKQEAIKLLQDTIEGYRISTDHLPPNPDVSDDHNIQYEGRTPTGGDWYSFGDEYGGYTEIADSYAGHDDYGFFEEGSWGGRELQEKYEEKAKEETKYELNSKYLKTKQQLNKELNVIESLEENNRNKETEKELNKRFWDLDSWHEKAVKEMDSLDFDTEDFSSIVEFHKKYDLRLSEDEDIESEVEDEYREYVDSIKNELWEQHIESLRDELGEKLENYSKVTCGGKWCVSQPSVHFEEFIANGDEFTVLRRGGDPRLAIRTTGGMISEIQGVDNKEYNISPLDFIDLLNVPYIDDYDILEYFSNSNSDFHDNFVESLSSLEDHEITGPIENFLKKNSEIVLNFMERDEDGIYRFLEYFGVIGSSTPTKMTSIMTDIIRDNLDEIKLNGTIKRKEWGKEYTWVHAALAAIAGEDIGYSSIYKEIFVGKEKEILSQFFDSVMSSEYATGSQQWLVSILPQLELIFGDLPKQMLSSMDFDTTISTDRVNPSNYFTNRLYLKDDISDLQSNPDVYYNMVAEGIKTLSYEGGKIGVDHASLLNGVYELGLIVSGGNKEKILRVMTSHIMRGLSQIFLVNSSNVGNKAMWTLNIFFTIYPEIGVHSDIINYLKGDSDVQWAWKWHQEHLGGSPTTQQYRDNYFGDSGVVEGLPNAPNAPEGEVNNPAIVSNRIGPLASSCNWYKQIKIANALAQSLGVEPGGRLYQKIQKWENYLKADGNWEKIKQVKKNRGKEEAINFLKTVIDSYTSDDQKSPVEIKSPLITHLGRTSTGGDWYLYENNEAFPDAETDNQGNVMIDSDKHEELIHETDKRTIQYYVEGIIEQIEFDNEEPELDPWGEPEQSKAEQAKDAARGITSIEELIEFSNYFGEPLDISEVQSEMESAYELAEDEWRSELNRRLEPHIDAVESIACGGKWCISSGRTNATTYIVKGYNFLVLRRMGDPRIAIMYEDGEGIKEIKGTNNNFDNVDPLDILDLYENPYFADIDIEHGWNEENIDLDEVYGRIFDFPDDEVTEKTAARLNEMLDKIISEMYEMDAISNDPEKLYSYIDKQLDFAQKQGHQYVYNTFMEKLSQAFQTQEFAYSEFVDGILQWVRDNDISQESLERIKKIAANINEKALQLFFDEFVGYYEEIDTVAAHESLIYFFGDRAKKYLNTIKDPLYNLASADIEQILRLVYSGSYKTMQLENYIRSEREFNMIAGYVINNMSNSLGQTNAIYLNNLLDISKRLDYTGSIWFYIQKKVLEIVKNELQKHLEFLQGKREAFPGSVFDPEYARCEKLVSIINKGLPSVGFSDEIINWFKGDLDYRVCEGTVRRMESTACNWDKVEKMGTIVF